VELIILLAHKLKLKVIAEGIETAKHWEHLRDFGCNLGQGYFFSPPIEPEAASKLLCERSMASHAKVTGA
jgi:EAL domain-containing protein (putative c-di-GMP-specific phosphodiesterase class I)